MPRRRVAVALLPPPRVARSVQTLRRAVADPRLEVLPPHLTLVPPINVADAAYADGRALLRAVASTTEPFVLRVGPAGTFAPATPTLHLELGGATDALHTLRARLRSGPFERPDAWPFHPHVTLREELHEPAPALAAAVLAGDLGPWPVDRVQLLEQRRDAEGRRCWVPVAEEPFGRPAVVGRGGIELELRTSTAVPEEAASLLDRPVPTSDPFADDLVVTAGVPGAHPCDPPLGVIAGSLRSEGRTDGYAAVLQCVVVDPAQRRLGIGRHLLRRWCHEAARRGAGLVSTELVSTELASTGLGDDAGVRGLLRAEGFVDVGTTQVRRLSE